MLKRIFILEEKAQDPSQIIPPVILSFYDNNIHGPEQTTWAKSKLFENE
jgi:hypothetical protein